MGKINTKFGELKINRVAFGPGARTEITSGYFGKTTLDEDILSVVGLSSARNSEKSARGGGALEHDIMPAHRLQELCRSGIDLSFTSLTNRKKDKDGEVVKRRRLEVQRTCEAWPVSLTIRLFGGVHRMLKLTRPSVELVGSSEASLADLQELGLEFVHSTPRTRKLFTPLTQYTRDPPLPSAGNSRTCAISISVRPPSLALSRCLMFNLKFMHHTSVFSAPSAVCISSLSNLRDNDLSLSSGISLSIRGAVLSFQFIFEVRSSTVPTVQGQPYNILLLEFPRTFPGAFFHPPAMRGPGAKPCRPFVRTMTVDTSCSDGGT
ncbi:hypothetical protein B0H14DRAFT_2604134 [Mycena olivaceomarginata]|nr:hypothetical protein B0H14DRAFT_2604134 [Mycena olivaceomarginata]